MRFEDMKVGMRVVVAERGYEYSKDREGKLATINKLGTQSPIKYFVYVTWDDEELNEKYPHLSYSYPAGFFNPVEDNMINQVDSESLKAAWNLLSDASGIGEGDRVRITRGWEPVVPHAYAVGGVKQFIGKEVVIKGIKNMAGFRALILENGWVIPYNVAEFVCKAKPEWKEQRVKLNDGYTAIIREKSVQVGCQVITFDNVEKVYLSVQAARAHAESN